MRVVAPFSSRVHLSIEDLALRTSALVLVKRSFPASTHYGPCHSFLYVIQIGCSFSRQEEGASEGEKARSHNQIRRQKTRQQ